MALNAELHTSYVQSISLYVLTVSQCDTQLTHNAGIGKSLAKRLADQGLNVVLVALPDDTLETTHEQLVADYPGVQFRKVSGCVMAVEGLALRGLTFGAAALLLCVCTIVLSAPIIHTAETCLVLPPHPTTPHHTAHHTTPT